MTDKRLPAELPKAGVEAFGFFRLQVVRPGNTYGDCHAAVITHDLPGDLTKWQLLDAFKDFLLAAGYVVEGDIIEDTLEQGAVLPE